MKVLNVLEIKNLKKEMRNTVRKRQAGLLREYIKYTNEKICCNILSMKEYKNAKAVFCFVGTKDEIDTTEILEEVLKDGKKLFVPKCRDKGIMDALEIKSLKDLELGAYGIMEPQSKCLPGEPREIDFAVIPCMSCDKQGHRLGHGGGYYDRFLKGNTFPKAVICREKLLMEIPTEETDVKMDFVVTEDGIFKV